MTARYNLLMLSGDSSIARGIDGAFYRMLARFSEYWRRVDILTPTAGDAQSCVIHDNVYVHPAPQHRLLQALFIKQQGQKLFSEREYHLIISHDFGFFYNGIGASWLLRQHDIPLVSEIHHIEGYPIATTQREKLWRWAAQVYIPFIAKQGAYFRVVNQQVADQLHDMGVPSEQIRLLYSLYLDLDLYRPLNLEKQYDVLFVGRLASNKGIMLLMEVIKIVKQTHPNIILAIRGEGDLKAQIEDFITQHSLELNVQFLPRVTDSSDMPRLYNQARMLVCASTVEGNPRVTIEAMACGTPIISTCVGIMPEVIQNSENGLLVDWDSDTIANAIKQLLDNERLYQTIADAGQKTVQQFDANSTIRDYALAYHQIIENAL
ncbi:MAG: glycosyltransferase family 4 protein [Chloroflexota bacterium]